MGLLHEGNKLTSPMGKGFINLEPTTTYSRKHHDAEDKPQLRPVPLYFVAINITLPDHLYSCWRGRRGGSI